MLCPEVCNFKAPESTFTTEILSQDEDNYLKAVQKFSYNHLVSVVLPDTFKVPESLTQALSKDCDYYKITNLKLSEFISRDFIQNFVNKGYLHILSINKRLDRDNCIALTSAGILVLNLTKDSFLRLGLEGAVSHFHTKTKDRFVVTLDLKQAHLKPGKASYERIKKRLDEFEDRFTVIAIWEPPNLGICPSSLAKYFHDLHYKTELCQIKNKTHTLYSINTPFIGGEKEEFDCEAFVEWLGLVAVEGSLEGETDEYLSSYETPTPNTIIGQVKFLQWRGFFTANQIVRLINELRTVEAPWVALYVQGFSDAPIAWTNQEHHFYTNGDNGFITIFTKNRIIHSTQKCSRKRYQSKMA